MANSTTLVTVEDQQPLTAADRAALRASVEPRAFWEPTAVWTRSFGDDISCPATITTAADIWRLVFAPPSAVEGIVFYPISLRWSMRAGVVGLNTMWTDTYLAATDACSDSENQVWFQQTQDTAMIGYDGSAEFYTRGGAVSFRGYPQAPIRATDRTTVANNAIGGLQFTVDTYDATTRSSMALNVDARWLAFPEGAVRNAGFYVPRLYFRTN